MKKIFVLAFVSFFLLRSGLIYAETLPSEKRTFTITGYYSPLPDQNFYITGSYEAEIRLNGRGIAGANGVGVYPGMIAAPKTYDFGTKICIPGFGCGTVHDRGGAIVHKGERSLARHDRLDLWMGYGEEGLLRALAWGVQHIDCEMYAPNAPIADSVNFDVPLVLSDVIDLPNRENFEKNLLLGSTGPEVERLQLYLQVLGLYHGSLDGTFSSEVQDAVFAFQRKHFIVENGDDYGAGVFGPQTRDAFSDAVYKAQTEQRLRERWDEFHFDESLSKGQRNEDVLHLQQILVEEELLDVRPTAYFGPKTKEAVVAFQLRYGIIESATDAGAGRVGPKTQEVLNELVTKRAFAETKEKDALLAYQKDQQRFQVLVQKSVFMFPVVQK